jgi:hypothetical protein
MIGEPDKRAPERRASLMPGPHRGEKGPPLPVLALLFWLGAVAIACIPSEFDRQTSTLATPAPLKVQEAVRTDLDPTLDPTYTVNLPLIRSSAAPTATPAPSPTPAPVRFAVIGDYGSGDQNAAAVASLVQGWSPDFVITVGDNNYPSGAGATIDDNIGQFYHEYIHPYTGTYGEGASVNRFFPTLGNHDWDTPGAGPYLDYFSLPGNERYYDFVWSPVHFFALDSDSREPDGVNASSTQADWLQARLAAASEPWKIIYMHHPPYSSGLHGSITWMRWPFQDWGASAVLSGHDHTYERIQIDAFPYFVNGLGGGARYFFGIPVEGSQVRYNADYGAMLVEATAEAITFQFITQAGEIVDTFTLFAPW